MNVCVGFKSDWKQCGRIMNADLTEVLKVLILTILFLFLCSPSRPSISIEGITLTPFGVTNLTHYRQVLGNIIENNEVLCGALPRDWLP